MPDEVPTMINEFQLGVQARNVPLVKQALGAGVKPDTEINGRHPLWVLLGTGYDDMPEAVRKSMTPEEFSNRTSAIVETLFDQGVRVAEEGKYKTETQSYLADRFLLSDDVSDAANIIIHAIHETLEDGRSAYQPDIPKFVAGFLTNAIPEGVDYKPVVGKVFDALDHLHETVRERLQNPQSAVEQDVAKKLGDHGYWKEPLARPDMAEFLKQLGLGDGQHVVMLPRNEVGDLSHEFAEITGPAPIAKGGTLETLEKKAPKQVLEEMRDDLVGLGGLKRDAQRLVFRQAYDQARADEHMVVGAQQNFSTVYVGNDGIGKSSFARKQAELLVSLGLAGPTLAALTDDNLAIVAGSMTQQAVVAEFRRADVIIMEVPETRSKPEGAEGVDVAQFFLAALQISLKGRDKPPVIFLTGRERTIENAMEVNPGFKELFGKFKPVEDPTPEDLGEALDRKLKKNQGLEIDRDGHALVLQDLAKAKSRLGSLDFRNMREINDIVAQLPDIVAERLFSRQDGALDIATAPDSKEQLKTVTADDVRALGINRIAGGPNVIKRPRIGF